MYKFEIVNDRLFYANDTLEKGICTCTLQCFH